MNKFRGYDLDNHKMHYSQNLNENIFWCLNNNGVCFKELGDSMVDTQTKRNEIVMQFTGREDAEINGIEVWESDIIENCDTKELQVVYWNEDKAAWYCRYLNDGSRVVSLADSLGNLNKKVGNIYENPELIS